ncbi:1,4-dihydroxy-2-naphthoyl-CoA hydrolase [Nitrosomonas sp. PY1]|uniref:hotdog fold thioesterase n=1 Tax=Nitrosomonas sp. PY1 TaxID=1803906 RepID=UPI001FC7CF6C|nr:hotdog fold thioesterase [Nitrosomonas sp. PY1]GKS69767.1 1,4-dihydroxy-2-naphthoyl-CoA hydrolase [Nitrosomonas sp. PY1]
MTSIWFKDYTVEYLEGLRNANMAEYIGIHFIEIGADFLKGGMPIDYRTMQPFGILHGGASCVLSETMGSIAGWMTIDPDKYRAVGLELNINHIRAVTRGSVIGTCTPLHVGKRTQVWQTDITEEATGKRVAISRLTLAIIEQGTLSAQKEHVAVEKMHSPG